MINVSIIIDEQSKYTIDLKNEYDADDFIATFEKYISKVKKLRTSSEQGGKSTKTKVENQVDAFSNANELFTKLTGMVEALGSDIYREDHSTMRSFKFNRPVRIKGFVWLQPRGEALIVYLRKGNYGNVDMDKKIIQKTTFGGYPMLYIKHPNEIDYAFNIIKKIYQLTK